MTDIMAAVRAFYMAKRGSLPAILEAADYYSEECREFVSVLPPEAVDRLPTAEEWEAIDREHFAKEAADVVFTLTGLCATLGIDLDVAFELVCASNMTKEFTPQGKVQKGPDYIDPDMRKAVDGWPW